MVRYINRNILALCLKVNVRKIYDIRVKQRVLSLGMWFHTLDKTFNFAVHCHLTASSSVVFRWKVSYSPFTLRSPPNRTHRFGMCNNCGIGRQCTIAQMDSHLYTVSLHLGATLEFFAIRSTLEFFAIRSTYAIKMYGEEFLSFRRYIRTSWAYCTCILLDS